MAAKHTNNANQKAQQRSRTRSIAFVALTVAIMAVSAWITVPLGPIPFTLQMFAITFAICVLSPKEAMAAILCYLVLGAIGVPVFSGMRGGFGVLAGSTGGFLWGYIFGVAAGAALLWAVRRARGERAISETPGKKAGKHAPGAAGFGASQTGSAASAQPASKALMFVRNCGFELLAGILFTAISYFCGCLQFVFVADVNAYQAFFVCCAPFIVVDLCKIVAAVVVAEAVRKAVGR